MGTVVLAHVDYLGGFFYTAECGLHYCLRRPDKCNHCTVGCLAGVHVEHRYPFNAFYSIYNCLDFLLVAPLAEVGYALYDSLLLHVF